MIRYVIAGNNETYGNTEYRTGEDIYSNLWKVYERKGKVVKIEMELINYDIDEILEKIKDKKYKNSKIQITRVMKYRFKNKLKDFSIFS